jgi:integrase
MNLNSMEIKPSVRHYDIMLEELNGYWSEDLWEVRNCPLFTSNMRLVSHQINFDIIENVKMKIEFKFYFFKRINNLELSLPFVWRNKTQLKRMSDFICEFYPYAYSIIDIPYDKFKLHYQTFLQSNGIMNTKTYLQLYNQIYLFYFDFYDERDELDKDIWDVRKLNIDYNKSKAGDYKMNFTSVPSVFRPLVKKYIKIRVLSQESMTWASGVQHMAKLPVFFNYIHNRYPNWTHLKALKRGDVEDFLLYLRNSPMGGKSTLKHIKPSDIHINRVLINVETLVTHIERYEWEEAPIKSVKLLFFPEDKPKLNEKKADQIKYIPDFIWEQIIDHIEELPKEIVPIVLLLEASGFRISDVVALKINCLVQKEDGYWLVGEQRKVKDKHHSIPISKEIAEVVIAQQKLTKEISTPETNPNNFLFPTYRGTRKGKPIAVANITNNLNKLARDHNIVGEKGDIYWFKAHGFRHRYGVNLINNGMNILHVQKLMAHASPEMTLVYAQIHDSTLRREWEKAKNNGAVKLDPSGKIVAADMEQQAEENGLELEWIRHNLDSIRLDHGLCIKSPKQSCDFLEQTIEPPCIKNNCRSFHADHTFLDFYKVQIDKMESDILIYQKTGRIRSIELIQPKLKRYKEIYDGILNNGGIFGQPKAKREYTIKERERGEING